MSKSEMLVIGGIVALLVLFATAIVYESKQKAVFLAACIKHEPEYKCQVQWKQMHPDPLVVYAPMNK